MLGSCPSSYLGRACACQEDVRSACACHIYFAVERSANCPNSLPYPGLGIKLLIHRRLLPFIEVSRPPTRWGSSFVVGGRAIYRPSPCRCAGGFMVWGNAFTLLLLLFQCQSFLLCFVLSSELYVSNVGMFSCSTHTGRHPSPHTSSCR
jgi:hypothetical protein